MAEIIEPIVEQLHFGAETAVDAGYLGKHNSVALGLLGTVGFYFELADLVSDYLFLAVLQNYVDNGKEDAHIVENFIIGFYASVVLPWLLILLSSTLKYYGRTGIHGESTSTTTSWKCKTTTTTEKNGVPDRDESGDSGFVLLSSIIFDNFVIRGYEAFTCSHYDPRRHANFPVDEMESMRNLSIAILEDIPQLALKLGLFFALNESGRNDLDINDGTWAFIFAFVTTVLNLVKAIWVEFYKKKDYPTLSFCAYLGHIFSFIHPNDEYVAAIAASISLKTYSATILHLMGGEITDAGMKSLAKALEESSNLVAEDEEDGSWIQRPPLTLRRINLGWNLCGDEGVFALTNALESYEGIKMLDLRGCENIGEEGYEKLGELLVCHDTLHTLILSNSDKIDAVGGVSKSWADQITGSHLGKKICFEDPGNSRLDRLVRRANRDLAPTQTDGVGGVEKS